MKLFSIEAIKRHFFEFLVKEVIVQNPIIGFFVSCLLQIALCSLETTLF